MFGWNLEPSRMSWMLLLQAVAALLVLSERQHILHEGYSLTEAVDRSEQFIAKPGTCPTSGELYPGAGNCEWDLHCPGWQKCCRSSHQPVCSNASSAKFFQNRGYRLNVTMTKVMDFNQLMSNDKSLWNHTKRLQTMVTGALHFDVSVYYLNSWLVPPDETATSVIIDSNSPLSMSNVTAKLHFLLQHMQISSLRVEDVDECQESVLHQCSAHSLCNNTVGSYYCTCQPGYTDVDPSDPGTNCAEIHHTAETVRDTFGTTSSRPTSLPWNWNTGAEASSTPPAAFVAFVTKADDEFNAQTTTYSSSTTPAAPFMTWTPTALETTPNAPKTETSFSANSTATLPNSQISDMKIKTTTITLAADISSSSVPAATLRTIDSPPATTVGMDTNISHNPTVTDSTTTGTGAILMNTIAISTTNTTTLRPASEASVLGDISVQCSGAAITVTISQNFLVETNIQESDLYLGSRECGVNGGNTTHVQLTVAWNQCSTRLVHNETHYTAAVTLFSSVDENISPAQAPTIRLEVPILCVYMKNMVTSAELSSMGYEVMKEVITDSGSSQMRLQLMNGSAPLPHNPALSPREAVVMEVSLNTSSEQIKVVVSKCWATPTRDPEETYRQTFLESSCPTSIYAKVLINGNSSTSRVSVQIFSIVNMNVLYLHCQVNICIKTGEDSCVPDCGQKTRRTSRNIVGSAFQSLGPLHKADEESFDEKYSNLQIAGLSCLGIGVTIFFLITFLCLLYCQRNRIGNYNLTITPKQDNRTFFAFNA